jgi:hypothetical protein
LVEGYSYGAIRSFNYQVSAPLHRLNTYTTLLFKFQKKLALDFCVHLFVWFSDLFEMNRVIREIVFGKCFFYFI